MIVVADTTPLSELAKIGRLEILRDIFGGVSHFAPSQKSKVSQCVSPWEKGGDLDARKIAKSKGLQLIGTVGVLLLAKENSLIFSVKDVMDELIANGMWISQRFYLEVLAIALEK